jgi:hypothetical protein
MSRKENFNSLQRTFKPKGRGLLNKVINKLPIELHLPGYNFCGPGTKLEKRLARGDLGVNELDEACKAHDISYSQNQDLKKRHLADKELLRESYKRLHSSNSKLSEKAASLLVAGAMKSKLKLGMGARRKKSKKRIIKAPKRGGFLPLVLAGLGTLAGITGGVANVVRTINESKAAEKQLQELKRHNLRMEPVAGKGLKIGRKKIKRGKGLYLKPYNSSKNS